MIRETDTKDKLKKALTILLNEKSLNDISVSELTKEAYINRGTFYLHYDDKMDLVDNLVEEIFEELKEILTSEKVGSKYSYDIIKKVIDYVKDDFDFIYALTMNSYNYINDMLRKFLLALIETLPELKHSIDNHPFLPKDYSTEFFLSLNSGIILHWIRKGGVESTEELANYFYQVSNLKTT